MSLYLVVITSLLVFFILVLGNRPPASTSIPGSLKNNSAITITSKSGPRTGFHRVIARPPLVGQNRTSRPIMPGQKIADIRNRLGEMRSFAALRGKSPMSQGRLLRPNLPGSLSITKITKDAKKSDNNNSDSNPPSKMDVDTDDDTQVLDSEDETKQERTSSNQTKKEDNNAVETKSKPLDTETDKINNCNKINKQDPKPMVLTTDERLPPEDVLENKSANENCYDLSKTKENPTLESNDPIPMAEPIERKTNPLKNYRHQRPVSRTPTESSLSQLEKTASVLNKEGMPDFRKNLDDITQSYSPNGEEKVSSKTKKKKSPSRADGDMQGSERQASITPGMSHSVSSLLGPSGGRQKPRKGEQISSSAVPVASVEGAAHFRAPRVGPPGPYEGVSSVHHAPLAHGGAPPAAPTPPLAPTSQGYPPNAHDGSYPQYPGKLIPKPLYL